MIGRKIYYELVTGDVILTVPEKHSNTAINTTKEQDFAMYDVLAARNPKSIGVVQLDYGQYRAEFQSARSVKVDLETGGLLFEYPAYEQPLTEQVKALKVQNDNLIAENELLRQQIPDLNIAMAEIMGVM